MTKDSNGFGQLFLLKNYLLNNLEGMKLSGSLLGKSIAEIGTFLITK